MAELLPMGDERFVLLTTFRRSGVPVATPVWVLRDGDALVVTTPAGSGKVKRLRHDPRATVVPCGRRGRVAPGAAPAAAAVTFVEDAAAADRLHAGFRRKYGVQWRLAMLVERLVTRGRGQRLLLRLAPGTAAP